MRNFFAIIQYTLIYFSLSSHSLLIPAGTPSIHLPTRSVFSDPRELIICCFFFLYLTYFCKHNGFRFHSSHKWRGFFEGGGVCFIFLCDGIVISVYPFNICCSHLSFPQLTDASYFSFLGKQQTWKVQLSLHLSFSSGYIQ